MLYTLGHSLHLLYNQLYNLKKIESFSLEHQEQSFPSSWNKEEEVSLEFQLTSNLQKMMGAFSLEYQEQSFPSSWNKEEGLSLEQTCKKI